MHFYIKATFYSLLISLVLVSFVRSDCEIVINEINLSDPQKPEKQEYIELKSICDTEIPLRGYKLVGFNCQSESGTIDLIITLWNDRTDKNGFFTIGGSDVLSANLKIPNNYIRFKSHFEDKNTKSITEFFINKNLRAIGLLHDEKKLNSFSDFTLSKKQPSIKISDAIFVQLKNYLIDLVVYGENKACATCKLFEKINDEFALKKYILREFPINSEKNRITLNRCAAESAGFLPEKFKLGNPTPSKPNDCTGPHFLLDDYIPVNVPTAYVEDYDDFEGASCSNQNTCAASTHSTVSEDNNMIGQAIRAANETSTRDICTNQMLYPDGSNTALTVEQENRRKRHIDADHSKELEWKTTKFFK